MSKSLNKVQLIGRLGKDPEVRPAGTTKVANLSIATSRSFKKKDSDQWEEKTEWHRVVAWDNQFQKLASLAEKYCTKGDRIYIEGSLETKKWTDKKGEDRYTTEIVASSIILLGGKTGGSTEEAAPAEKPDVVLDDDDDTPF